MNDVATLIREGKVEHAESALNQRRDDSADWHYQRGLVLEAQGRIEEALDAYEAAVQRNPDHEAAMFRLAYDHDLYADEERAIELYEALAQRRPANANALINLAILYEDQGHYEDAYHCIERVLLEHPNHPRARMFAKDIESSMTMHYDENQERTRAKHNAIMDTPVSDFELSVRSRNCLKKMNINTLGDLLRVTEAELLAYKNFGETSLNEIKAMLKQKGLRLGQLKDEAAQQAARPAARRPIAEGAPEVLNKYLSDMEFSGRARKCFQRLNLVTVGDLLTKTEPELLAAKNFGQTSLNEVKVKLAELGLSLRKHE
ncbi:MAG: tetratricopeptide repeat protein [Phycisphaerae bacterium]|jgi:DNA-directed RNA polymerase subunit alpha